MIISQEQKEKEFKGDENSVTEITEEEIDELQRKYFEKFGTMIPCAPDEDLRNEKKVQEIKIALAMGVPMK